MSSLINRAIFQIYILPSRNFAMIIHHLFEDLPISYSKMCIPEEKK